MMIEMTGITKIFEPAGERRVENQGNKDAATVSASHDDVEFSQEAQEASSVAKLVTFASKKSEVRQERIDEAKRNIEEGTYKVEQVILQVAARIAKYIAN